MSASRSRRREQFMHYVYILLCADNSSYTGCTSDLRERIERHNNRHVPATVGRLPVKLVAHVCFSDRYKAFKFEKYLKSGSGRAFMKGHSQRRY
ncbi:MAG: GIY-YIG nuclease family protein [Parcubacteria group bacterium]